MSAATVKAIMSNLETIVESIGYELEDMSVDPSLESNAVCTVVYEGETFGESFGEKPDYNEVSVSLIARRRAQTASAARDYQIDIVHEFRDNVTVAALNTGALATSKLVFWVNHVTASTEFEESMLGITYEIEIRYREN